MSVILNQEKVIAATQKFDFKELVISKRKGYFPGESGDLVTAKVTYLVTNELGKQIDIKVINYTGQECNDFLQSILTPDFDTLIDGEVVKDGNFPSKDVQIAVSPTENADVTNVI